MARNNLDGRFGDHCEDNENEKKWDMEDLVDELRKKNRILELIVGLLIKDKEVLLKKELEHSKENVLQENKFSISILQKMSANLLNNREEKSLECLCGLLQSIGNKVKCEDVDLKNVLDEMEQIVEAPCNNQTDKIGRSIGDNSSQKRLPAVSISLGRVELRWSKNPWKPARLLKTAAGEGMSDDDKKTSNLYRKVRSVLNKLTPQKFNKLVNQVRELQIDTKERLQGVIDLIFDRAINEPMFSVAYAMMCKELQVMQVPVMNANTEVKKGIAFRTLLVTRCQMEFEHQSVDETIRNTMVKEINECSDAEKKDELTLKLEEYDKRQRVKSVNLIQFIGELFKQQMLTASIIRRCLQTLLDNKDEESLECLCKLLTTVGKELESKGMDLTKMFDEMKKIVEGKRQKVGGRIRFILQDVIDLRDSKWIPSRADANPKTIDQIQREAKMEQLNIQVMNMNTPRKDDRGNGPRGGGGNRQTVNDDGWSSVGRNNRQAFTIQTEKIRAAKLPDAVAPLGSSQLFGSWDKSAGGSKNQQPVTTSQNMNAALENIDMERRPMRSDPVNTPAGSYVPQTQGPNQDPSLKGVAPSSAPPNRPPTPPKADIKVQRYVSTPYVSSLTSSRDIAPYQSCTPPNAEILCQNLQRDKAVPLMSLVLPSPPNGPGNMEATQLIQQRRIAIPIIDPSTGEIFDENNSHPASSESSPRETPHSVLPNKVVQRAFAKQVLQALMEENRQRSSSVPTEQPLLHESSPPEHFQPSSQSMPSIASSEPLDDTS